MDVTEKANSSKNITPRDLDNTVTSSHMYGNLYRSLEVKQPVFGSRLAPTVVEPEAMADSLLQDRPGRSYRASARNDTS